jgi:hypothetical protein
MHQDNNRAASAGTNEDIGTVRMVVARKLEGSAG